MSTATLYKWRAKYGGMDTSMMARLKELKLENQRLKKMYAEERLKLELNLRIKPKKCVVRECSEPLSTAMSINQI